jgi:hypothetical protein
MTYKGFDDVAARFFNANIQPDVYNAGGGCF